jgi:uncharacterized membrane protein YphA (DoxX/SURF4 family)
MKTLRIIARFIVGLAFMFSGFVKAVDPLGSAYKFQDYFQAFNIDFLKDLVLPLAILLSTAEFVAGFMVLTGIRQKAGIVVIMLLMLIFTPLTLVLALTNPVSDCGCFGDAVHLTNWQTFSKNIILGLLAIFLFLTRNNIASKLNPLKEWILAGAVAFSLIFFSLNNLRYLPVIDFLPYKKNVKIAEGMVVPEGVQPDKYQTTFIYEKDGIKKEFDLTNYPADDSTWKFIDQKSILVEKGYVPPIHDFAITCNGEDITAKILSDKGFSVLMVSKKLAEAGKNRILEGFDFGEYCMNNGIKFYVLTSSGADEISDFSDNAMICTADETTLKTIVRSNPGYLLLQDGKIRGKWSWAGLPEKEWFANLMKDSY